MTNPHPAAGLPLWAYTAVRVIGIGVAGLALILFFQEVMVPVLKGDVERVQQDHNPPPELDRPGRASAVEQ